MPPRLVITNSVILNGGDAAIVLSMVGSLRREFGARAEIKVLCHSLDVARRYYGPALDLLPVPEEAHRYPARPRLVRKLLGETLSPRARLGWLVGEERRVAEAFRWADAIIPCGGAFLTDRYSTAKRLAGLRLALDSGKPVIFYGQSVGPFARAGSRRAFAEILRRAAAVTVRDQASLEEARALGVEAELTADEAFLLDVSGRTPNFDPRAGLAPNQPLVAVAMRSWQFPGSPPEQSWARRLRYYRAVLRSVEKLVRSLGARVLFISTCQGIPEYTHDDSNVALEVLEEAAADVRAAVTVERGWHHPVELAAILGRCDALISIRLHAAILAMLAGTPALAIGYEAKSLELFARMGLGEWCLDIAGDNLDNLPERAAALLDRRAALLAELPARLAAMREAAKGNARAVRRVLVARGVKLDG